MALWQQSFKVGEVLNSSAYRSLMYLAGNYRYRINAIAPPEGVSAKSKVLVMVEFQLRHLFCLRANTDMLNHLNPWYEGKP